MSGLAHTFIPHGSRHLVAIHSETHVAHVQTLFSTVVLHMFITINFECRWIGDENYLKLSIPEILLFC
jgi:hypothetical protein